jgi:WD40 repeat protein
MGKIQDVAFTPDGRFLLSASNDKVVRVWDLTTGQTVRTIRGEIGVGREGMIYAMALSPDGNWLAVAGWMKVNGAGKHGDIRLFDALSGRLSAVLSGHERVVYDLAFSGDGTRLASAGADRTAIVWDLEARRALATLRGHGQRITRVAFTRDEERVVTASDDRTLRLWRVDDGAALAVMHGHSDSVRALAVSPLPGLIASGGYDRTIRLWDDRDGRAVRVLAEQTTQVVALRFSLDGRKLISGVGAGPDNDVHVWTVPEGRALLSYRGHDNIVVALDVSPDGRTAASGGGNRREIHLWSLEDGSLQQVMGGVGDAIWTVAFSADGGQVAWSRTHPCPSPAACTSPPPLELSVRLPDERLPLGPPLPLRSSAGFIHAQRTSSTWSLSPRSTGKRGWPDTLDVLNETARVASIARDASSGHRHNTFTFTPDRSAIISGGMNGELAAYDLQGKLLGRFDGHTGDIWSLAVSPDGRLLASGSADQTLRLWDIAGRQNLVTLFHGRNDEWVAWTPSGYYASSPMGDQHVGWHVNRGAEQAAEFYPARQFRKRRMHPDVLEDTLLTRSEATAIGRMHRSKRIERIDSMRQLIKEVPSRPTLIDPPRGNMSDPVQQFVVQVDASTEQLLLNVNGRPTRGDNRTEDEQIVIREARLERGKNTLEFVARNASGDSRTLRTFLSYEPAAGTEAIPEWRKPVLYLLAIGVAEYADGGMNLEYPDNDVQALSERLEQEKGGIYGDVRVKTLVNTEARRADVVDALTFLEQMTQDDLAVLFIAGHGKQDTRGDFFFLPHDADQQRLRSTAVKWVEFKDLLGNLPGKVLLLADACHSADIFGGKGRRSVLDMGQLATEFADAEAGVIVFTSSQGKEFSLESDEWGHGAFTKALLDGLNGEADFDRDGVIHQSELEAYVKRGVVRLTGGKQHPITIRPQAMPDFPLAIVPSGPS